MPRVDGNNVMFSWGPPGTGGAAAGYVLEAGTSRGIDVASFTSAGNSFSTVAPNGTYFVRVRAINACGVSPPSNEANRSCAELRTDTRCAIDAEREGQRRHRDRHVGLGQRRLARYRLEVGTTSGASNTTSQTVTGTSAAARQTERPAIISCGSGRSMRAAARGHRQEKAPSRFANAVTLKSITVTGPVNQWFGRPERPVHGDWPVFQRVERELDLDGRLGHLESAWQRRLGPGSSAPWAWGTRTSAPGRRALPDRPRAGRPAERQLPGGRHHPPSLRPGPAMQGGTLGRRIQPNHLRCTFDGGASRRQRDLRLGDPGWFRALRRQHVPETVNCGRRLRYGCGTFGSMAKPTISEVKLDESRLAARQPSNRRQMINSSSSRHVEIQPSRHTAGGPSEDRRDERA